MNLLEDLPQRAKVAAGVGLICVLAGGAALGVGPLIRGRLLAEAARRGIELQIGQVRPGWMAIWLRDTDVSLRRMPGLTVHVDALRIGLGWRFSVSGVALHGASVDLKGESDELQRQLLAYRAEHNPNARVGSDGPELHYAADGVQLRWQRRPNEPTERVWALSYERRGEIEELSLGLARVSDGGVELEARDVQARLRRELDPAAVESAGTVRRLLSLHAEGVQIAITESSSDEPQTPTRSARPRHFQADSGRGVRLRAGLAELSAIAARLLPVGAGLTLEGLRLQFRQGNDCLNFGPSTLRAGRTAEQIELSLLPKPEASGTPLEFKVSLPISEGEVHADLRGGPVSLHSLGIREGDFGLREVQAATVQAASRLTLAPDGSSLAFSGTGVLDRVSLKRSELSALPLTGIRLGLRVRGTTTVDGSQLVLDDGELSLGEVHVQGAGSLRRGEGTVQAHWSGGVPLATCQAFLDATPRGLAPLLGSLRMSGTFAVQARLDYDSEHPSDTRVRLNVANDCHIEQVPPELTPRRFQTFWRREVKGPDKRPMEVESGPGSPDWVPYDALSPFMETAVLVCEDGHFPYHRGFDFEAIENSIRDNLIKGRFARGASTITMQLAKNLYLGKEKTLGRKLQEAVLTQLLEQELSKQELMELYLNVIEFAPGIYGIGPGAHYYFAKRPSDLSLGQALYMASILPNPEHQHFDASGKVSAAWTRYLQRLMHIAKKIGRITDEQLAVGLAEQVAFRVADSGSGAAMTPLPAEGSDTPSELSP